MKKSYHSSEVPIRLATITLRTDDGALAAGTRFTVDIWCLPLPGAGRSTPIGWTLPIHSGRNQFQPIGPRSASATEPALPLPVRAQRPDEIHLPEVGPQRLTEIELAVRGLPHQESGQSLLPGGSDDQVRVGLALSVEMLRDVFDVERLRELVDGGAALGMLGKQGA